MFVYDFLLWQTNFLLSPNSRCGWTELTNRMMRRAFGPSESLAFFLSLDAPFCTEGWASSLSRSGHVWMCSSFVFHLSPFCLWSGNCNFCRFSSSVVFIFVLSHIVQPLLNIVNHSLWFSSFLVIWVETTMTFLHYLTLQKYFGINSWIMSFNISSHSSISIHFLLLMIISSSVFVFFIFILLYFVCVFFIIISHSH